MTPEQRVLHDDLVALEHEINAALSSPAGERGAVRLLWKVSAVTPGRLGVFTARRHDSLSDVDVEISSPTVAGLAKLIQRHDLGARAQVGELSLHDAVNWRIVNDDLNAHRRMVAHLRDRVAELESRAA